jgi:hypothetical protein
MMDAKVPIKIRVIAIIVLIMGAAMLVYWGIFILQGISMDGIPVLSEFANSGLAFISGVGLLCLRKWSIPTSLFTAGMWAYGVLGGINLVLEKGLDFSSPFGAITDAILFPLILVFAVCLSLVVWRYRAAFH